LKRKREDDAPASKSSEKPGSAGGSVVLPVNLEALRAMKERLKEEVQKKAKISSAQPTKPPAPEPPKAPVPQPNPAVVERVKEIQNKLNAKLAALQGRGSLVPGATVAPPQPPPITTMSSGVAAGPRPLRLDAEGREIDEQGRVISSGRIPVVATLAINKRVQRESLFKLETPTIETDPTKNRYFDPRMPTPKLNRPRRGFNFVEAGTYVKKAQRMRTKLAKELLESSVGEEGDVSGLSEKSLILKEAEDIIHKEEEPVPDVEWWDAPLLINKEHYDVLSADESDNSKEKADAMVVVDEEDGKAKQKENGKSSVGKNINERRLTHLVEHPVSLHPPSEKPPLGAMPLKLTKAEQKKMRRRARAERQREQQERVLLGLEPPLKNRMKISNMMKVLTTEAVQDPTQIEKMVRAEMEERAKAHNARNQERKLTPEQKRLKKMKKMKEDTSLITYVALFRVGKLSDVRHKYKVEMNAQQNFLTGCAVLYRVCCLVLVEGGPRGIERFKKLMLRRVDWNDFTKTEEEGEPMDVGKEKPKVERQNYCDLVWEGTVLKAAFKNFQVDAFPSEKDARKFLKLRGVPHYWDACRFFRRDLAPPNPSVQTIVTGGGN